jgi:predicted dehydrogenase
VLNDPRVDAVFVLVGHNIHARFVCEALEAGKHVFVEKPLAMNAEELARVAEAVGKTPDRLLMLGFNRRFSPHTVKMKGLLAGRSEPLCMSMTVNAGIIPPDHWTQDPERGGGRIIGEGCHFIDLLAHVAGSPVTTVSAVMVGEGPAVRGDKTAIVLGFADGSVGTVNYFSNGSKSYPKEMLEVFSDGRVLRMENFRQTLGYGFKGFKKFKTSRQDKGHGAEVAAFVEAVAKGGAPLIPFGELSNITLASFAAVESARTTKTVAL